ncbi:hypothetical protein G6F42_028420 [Rhizopus arrhizus]|nr:hypothetical protein G6F42_028420 [Rhizopus arrhizus]
MNQHWIQLGYQIAESTAGAAWSFAVTYLILFVMNKIPGLSLRVDRESELQDCWCQPKHWRREGCQGGS